MNRIAAALLTIAVLAALPPPSAAQSGRLMSPAEAGEAFTRAVQLVESTMLALPGLARAAAPVLENAKQAQQNLATAGNTDPGQTYALLSNLKAYLALADAMPKPFPFPAEAEAQFTELRSAVTRLQSHLAGLLDSLAARLASPDPDNLARYAEENLKVGRADPNNPRVVLLGDSITDGWRIQEYFPDREFLNRGISGQTTGQMLGRMKADVIDLSPRAVVILAGTNDLARGVPLSRIEDNLTVMAELAKLHNIRVVMASLLPVHDYGKDVNPQFERTRQRPLKSILDLNTWMRDYCRRNGHTYLDYYGAMVDSNGFLQQQISDDGLHPNAAGYRIMAPLLLEVLQRVAPMPAGPRRR